MKKLIIFILAIGFLSSCYDDKSSSNYSIINSIIIDNTAAETINYAYQYDTLRITPVVYKEGVSDDDIEYTWVVSGNYIVPDTVGRTMTLKYYVDLLAYSTAYTLKLRATDKSTSIFVEYEYTLYVQSPFGTGLIVADTRDDGVSSDISLIMSENFSSSQYIDTVFYDVFSTVNKKSIDGKISYVLSSKYGATANALMIGSSNSLEVIDAYDFTNKYSNELAFVVAPETISILGGIYNASSGINVINNNGKLHQLYFQSGTEKFSAEYYVSDADDYYITAINKSYWNWGMLFDEVGGRMLILNGTSRALSVASEYDGQRYSLNDFGDYECLNILLATSNNMVYFIMKHRETGVISNFTCYVPMTYPTTNIALILPQEKMDYTTDVCPDVDKAVAFTALEMGSSVFYATSDKIYSVKGTEADGVTSSVQYEANPGEVITNILGYSSYGMYGYTYYTNPDPSASADSRIVKLSAASRLMIVVTQNESTGEGFIRTMAIDNFILGTLEQDKTLHKEFGGFGKITSIALHK